MTNREETILAILWHFYPKEMYGLDIVKHSKGRLKRGSIYVYLNQLEEKNWIESRKEEIGNDHSRRLYKIKDGGRRALQSSDSFDPASSLGPSPT